MKSMNSFKFGLVIYGSYPRVLQDNELLLKKLIETAKDTDFDVIEIPNIEQRDLWDDVRDIAIEAAIDLVACAGPSCVFKGWNLSSIIEEDRKHSTNGMKNMVDFAYAIGARELAFISGKDPGPQHRDVAVESLIKSIREIDEYANAKASKYRLVLSLEPADRNVTHKQLIGPTSEAADLVAKVYEFTDHINITLDMSHIPQLNESFEQSMNELGGMVAHAHLANAFLSDKERPEYGDKHPRFGFPGSEFAEVDIKRFVDLLFKKCLLKTQSLPYKEPVISLEVKPAEGMDPSATLAGAKRSVFRALRHLA